MLPAEVSSWLISQGPAGVAILLLLGAVVYLFKRYDQAREDLILQGVKYAELAVTAAKVIETANTNTSSFIEAVQTFKLLADIDRRKR